MLAMEASHASSAVWGVTVCRDLQCDASASATQAAINIYPLCCCPACQYDNEALHVSLHGHDGSTCHTDMMGLLVTLTLPSRLQVMVTAGWPHSCPAGSSPHPLSAQPHSLH
jgi:hypothetical protein